MAQIKIFDASKFKSITRAGSEDQIKTEIVVRLHQLRSCQMAACSTRVKKAI